MSLYAFEFPQNPWYPDNEADLWWLYRSNRAYNTFLNTKNSAKWRRYKEIIRDSRFPEICSPPAIYEIAYILFYIGMGKEFTEQGGFADVSTLSQLDDDYRDGGEDEFGGCVYIERNKRYFTPRKVQFFS